MERHLVQAKSKIPMVRPTKSSILLTNHNSTKGKDAAVVQDETPGEVEEHVADEVKTKVRRRWRSVVHSWDKDVTQFNGLREWRDDYSDNLTVEKLIDISNDLLVGINSNQVGQEERDYRYGQSIYWLMKAAERGSEQAVVRLNQLVATLGEGVTERTWNDISRWLHPGMTGQKLGLVAFRKLDILQRGYLTVGQLHRATISNGSIANKMCIKEIRVRQQGDFESPCSVSDLTEAGKLYWSGCLPQFQLNNSLNTFSNCYEEKSKFNSDVLLCKLQQLMASNTFITIFFLTSLLFGIILNNTGLLLSGIILSQVLFHTLFNASEMKQFVLWSKVWSGACKLSNQEQENAQGKFVFEKTIGHYIRILPCLAYILNSSTTQNSGFQKVFLCSAGIQLIYFLSKFTLANFCIVLSGILPLIAPHASQALMVHTSNPWISTYLWILSDHYVWTLTYTTMLTLFLSTRNILSLEALALLAYINLGLGLTDLTWTSLLAVASLFFALAHNVQRFKALVVFIPPIILTISSLYSSMDPRPKVSPIRLTWQKYHQACPPNADISGQLLCGNFVGKEISWDGRVSSLDLKKKANLLDISLISVIKKFTPEFLSTYNSKSDSSCGQFNREFQLPCNAWQESLHICAIQVEMSKSLFAGNGQKIEVISSDVNKCKTLKPGHSIHFNGSLTKVCGQTEVKVNDFNILP